MTQPAVPEDFIRQITTHHNALLAFITSLVADYEQAQDVLQETHVELWRQAHKFEPGTNFFAWACTVARFKVLELRGRQRRDRLIFDDDVLEQVADEAQAHPHIASDDHVAMEECLNRLPPRQRELIRKRYAPDGTVKQLAAEMGRTAESLAVTLFRIRKALLECIQRKLEGGAT